MCLTDSATGRAWADVTIITAGIAHSPDGEGSCSQQETPDGQSHFVIPPAIDDCDDVPSPSQHRLSFASQRRHAGSNSISDDQDQDDATQSEEEEGDANLSLPKLQNSSGGEEEQEEEEEED